MQGTENAGVSNEANVPALTEYSGEETDETCSWWWRGKALGFGGEAGREKKKMSVLAAVWRTGCRGSGSREVGGKAFLPSRRERKVARTGKLQ